MQLITTLALASTATALAIRNPTTGTSTGFKLVAKLTHHFHDLTPSVSGWTVASAHTGAGSAAAILTSDPTVARIFYENGTAAEVAAKQTTLITDGGTPPAPYGVLVPAQGSSGGLIGINVGAGTFNTVVETAPGYPVVVNGLGQGTYLACNAEIPYYPGQTFVTLQYQYGTPGAVAVPEGCVAIKLVPQCAVLNTLPDPSYSSHEFAVEVKCYN
jgi:hypothetical protein